MILKIFNKIVDFIFPNKCYLCNCLIQSKGFCPKCFNNITIIEKYCPNCGFINENGNECLYPCNKKYLFDSISYCFDYSNTIAQLIHKVKYEDNTFSLEFFVNYLSPLIEELSPDIVTIVPLHFYKLVRRKYNHIGLVGNLLVKRSQRKMLYLPELVKKIKNTRNQMSLSAYERLTNLQGAFALNNKLAPLIKGKRIVLLDDIVTTGSTVHEICKVLRKAQPKEIHVVTISKVKGRLKK